MLAGDAYILINDKAVRTNISNLHSRAGYHSFVPVEVTLRPSNFNIITLGVKGTSGMSPSTSASVDFYGFFRAGFRVS